MSEMRSVREAVNWAGTQAGLAQMLGTTQASVSAWINRYGRMGSSYALKMHQFPQSAQLDRQLDAGLLSKSDMLSLGEQISVSGISP